MSGQAQNQSTGAGNGYSRAQQGPSGVGEESLASAAFTKDLKPLRDAFIREVLQLTDSEEVPNVEPDRVAKAINTLNPRERQVLKLRWGLEDGVIHTLKEIGTILGVTPQRVGQIEARAFQKLGHPVRQKYLFSA